jgi:bidirectional [NiFe] hydrogenase diaphorase subunit
MTTTVQTQVKTLVIDGHDVSARETETILEAAQEAGIFIPTMCHLKGLSEIGACRLCLVEVKGVNKLLPACVTKVEEGMEVSTSSERLGRYRRTLLELFFAEGNHICSVCVANGHCELQAMAQKLGMDHVRMPYISPRRQVDASHTRYTFDPNRCLLCTRCVRVCDEVEGAHTRDVMGRGIGSRIITDLNEPWGKSTTCTWCGKCVQVCPTGALVEKGKAVAESVKHPEFLPYLKRMREQKS